MDNFQKQQRLRQIEEQEQLTPDERLKQLQKTKGNVQGQLKENSQSLASGLKQQKPAVLEEIATITKGDPQKIDQVFQKVLKHVDKENQPKPEEIAASKTKIVEISRDIDHKMRKLKERIDRNKKRIESFIKLHKSLKQSSGTNQALKQEVQRQANELVQGLKSEDENVLEGISFYAGEQAKEVISKVKKLIREYCTNINKSADDKHRMPENDLELLILKMTRT